MNDKSKRSLLIVGAIVIIILLFLFTRKGNEFVNQIVEQAGTIDIPSPSFNNGGISLNLPPLGYTPQTSNLSYKSSTGCALCMTVSRAMQLPKLEYPKQSEPAQQIAIAPSPVTPVFRASTSSGGGSSGRASWDIGAAAGGR